VGAKLPTYGFVLSLVLVLVAGQAVTACLPAIAFSTSLDASLILPVACYRWICPCFRGEQLQIKLGFIFSSSLTINPILMYGKLLAGQ
jgi:hypothetical protein